MKTAIDSSVLWCILKDEPDASRWQQILERAVDEGSLCICPVVFAEIAPGSESAGAMLDVLRRLGIDYDAISPQAAWMAGKVFLEYRRAGGTRQAMIPDFLIASHAQVQCTRLAATDRGYLQRYFTGLKLISL